jgi:hypothetical protein
LNPIAPSDSSSSDKASLPACSRSYNTSELNRVTRSLEQHADVTLVTAEGDRVTLSSGSQAQVTYATYEDLRYMRGRFAEFHSETLGLEVSREYSILVDGDLNEKELRDIRKAVRAIEKIMRDFLSGDIAHAAAKAMKIGKLESISSLDASLQFERSLSVEQQVTGYVASEPAEPGKRANSPRLDFDELSRVAAGLASVSENGKLPYGRRFPVPTSRDCRDLQSEEHMTVMGDTITPDHIDKLAGDMSEVVRHSGVKPAKLLKPIQGVFSRLIKEMPGTQAGFVGRPRLQAAKLIELHLLERIKQLIEDWQNTGEKAILDNVDDSADDNGISEDTDD